VATPAPSWERIPDDGMRTPVTVENGLIEAQNCAIGRLPLAVQEALLAKSHGYLIN
jgi:hypothetical protein